MASSKNNDASVIGQGTEITGNVSGRGALKVDGKVTGSVSVTGPLDIGSGATVAGNVDAESLQLLGELNGDVELRGPAVLGPQAVYEGTLHALRVSMQAGARFSGRIESDFELDLSI
jgi:cytoskeletal protein CcmA (bactofilin family)